MSTSHPRHILPKVDENASQGMDSSHPVTQRKHVVLACTACKKRKTKCDGEEPCSMCTRKGTVCEYMEAQARLDQLKRDNAELTKKNEQYGTLLSFLRTGTTEESNEILSRLRNGPSIDAVLDHIEHGNLLLSPTALSSSGNVSSSGASSRGPTKSSSKRKHGEADRESESGMPSPSTVRSDVHRRSANPERLSVSFLTAPSAAVRASSWTKVTNDNALVSSLITMWFAYYHPFFQYIDKELFFEAFAEGQDNGSLGLCSPLLVNSIAASACHISERIQGKSTPWHDDFIGKKFLEESFRLWHEEEGRENLVNLQSAAILCDIVSHNGEDKRGTSFLLIACQLARTLGLLRDPSTWDGAPQDGREAEKWYRARAVAVWGLFHYQGVTCYSLKRFPLLRRQPVVQMPFDGDDTDVNKILFRAECQLAIILNELGTLHFSDDDGYAGFNASVEKTEEMYQRLLLFQSQLHPKITGEPDGDSSSLLLQIHIQYIIVSLFTPYWDSNRLNTGQKFYTTRSSTESRIALTALRQLLNLWSYCFGFGRCPYYLSHILLFDGLTALDELKRAQTKAENAPTDAYTGLMGSIVALGELAQRFVVCEAKLKALKVKSDEIGVHLSLRARQALDIVNQPDWLSKALAHFSRSSIPLDSTFLDSPDSVRLDHMLRTWSLHDEETETST